MPKVKLTPISQLDSAYLEFLSRHHDLSGFGAEWVLAGLSFYLRGWSPTMEAVVQHPQFPSRLVDVRVAPQVDLTWFFFLKLESPQEQPTELCWDDEGNPISPGGV